MHGRRAADRDREPARGLRTGRAAAGSCAELLRVVNPTHLKTFLSVERHRNYTRAAEELFLSQPAVSRQIHQLESDLGVRLFEQLGKSLHPTDAGRALVREAEQILGDIDRARERVRGVRDGEAGSLRLGASSTPGLYLLPPLLGEFHKDRPGVELQYVVENSLRIERRIIRNELDLGFVGAPLDHEALRMRPLIEDEIVCFASSRRRASRRARTIASLEDETWIVREKGSATRRLFEEWLARKGVRLRRTIELECPEAIRSLVRQGIGLSFVSRHGLRGEKGLKEVPIRDLHLVRTIYMVRHADKHTTPAMRRFLEIVETGLAR